MIEIVLNVIGKSYKLIQFVVFLKTDPCLTSSLESELTEPVSCWVKVPALPK
jgi:hypothetical protein